MKRAREGDSGAFRKLVEGYQGEIYNYFVRSTGSVEDSEDLTQQCFLNLYRSLERYSPKASVRTYLYRIATNLAISFSRKKRPPLSLDILVEGGFDPSEGSPPGPEDLTYAGELQKAYLEALAGLPREWALILDLRIGKELSYKEISQATGRSVSSVESTIFRAREKLSEVMAPYIRRGEKAK
jgi:RNA polymerase sigma-70 factor (ECF subfamily)